MGAEIAITPEEKRARVVKLREYHQLSLNRLGVPNAVFLPKLAYKPIGKTELYVSFFRSEISGEQDVYMEFTNKNNVPEDPNRTLYKWRYNSHFETEYETTEPHPASGHVRYLVPVGELLVIEAQKPDKAKISTKEVKDKEINFAIPDPDKDAPLEQMTVRDLAAIFLRNPCSTKQWLNDIIKGNE